jgi:hypothetical protein
MAGIAVKQQDFYRSLHGALRGMRDEGSGAWMLVALSFAYGVFHAAGPGHGKAVISSYMLANEVALRRGVLLSFLSAMLQAVTAIVVMTAVFFLLRGTAFSMADTTRFLEIASYALVTAFGRRDEVTETFGSLEVGGFDADGIDDGHIEGSAHYDGRAIDIFFRPHDDAANVREGWVVAHWLAVNANRLGIATLIYDERIWTARRSGEGWRQYQHPSGETANPTLRHLDHIHVDVVRGS